MLTDFLRENAMYLFVAAGLLAGVPVVWFFRERIGVRSWGGVTALCVIYSVSSVISAMLFAQLENLISTGNISGLGAISTYGIYLIGPFILMAAGKILRLKTAGVMDVFALYAMPSLFLMRCHCLVAGCCFGLPMYDTGFKWPTRESEMVFYIVMFIVLWLMLRKNKIPGQLFPLLMISYGCFRFINQWFRDTGTTGLHMSHIWSILCAIIGLSLLLEFRAKALKKQDQKGDFPEDRRNKK